MFDSNSNFHHEIQRLTATLNLNVPAGQNGLTTENVSMVNKDAVANVTST